jgi:hypothetical protein
MQQERSRDEMKPERRASRSASSETDKNEGKSNRTERKMGFWELTNPSQSSFLSSANVETKTIDKMISISLWNPNATNAE